MFSYRECLSDVVVFEIFETLPRLTQNPSFLKKRRHLAKNRPKHAACPVPVVYRTWHTKLPQQQEAGQKTRSCTSAKAIFSGPRGWQFQCLLTWLQMEKNGGIFQLKKCEFSGTRYLPGFFLGVRNVTQDSIDVNWTGWSGSRGNGLASHHETDPQVCS